MPASFLFDPNRCTGCHACRLACSIENELGPERSWRRIETFNPRRYPRAPLYHLSLACNHCDEPACLYACPARAYTRDAQTGAVLLEEARCIGCRYCAWACPYDAPVFDPQRGVMSKCTFCVHRLREGLKPACAALCPTGALDVADLPAADPGAVHIGLPEIGLGPRIQIRPLEPGRRQPEAALTNGFQTSPPPAPPPDSTVSLRTEWSLVLFTTLAATLVAVVGSSLWAGPRVGALTFLGLAAVCMGLAALHLGRPLRAHRALLNLRTSWLSREVMGLSVFIAGAAAYLAWAPGSRALGGLLTVAGLGALLCADRVYSVLERSRPGLGHSAAVVWTGLFLAGVVGRSAWLAGAVGMLRFVLYLLRKQDLWSSGGPARPLLGTARLGIGFVLPMVLWWVDLGGLHPYIIVTALVGELIDRSEFFLEAKRRSPARQLEIDLQHELATARPDVAGVAAA